MITVSVPCLYDSLDTFIDGALVSIDVTSTIVGIEQKPAGPFVPGYNPGLVDTLRVADAQRGTFYLDLTLAEYEAIVAAALQGVGGSKEITTVYNIGASPVSVITDTDNLFNITINAIIVDNVPLDISRDINYTPSTDSTINFALPLAPHSVVQVIYNKN